MLRFAQHDKKEHDKKGKCAPFRMTKLKKVIPSQSEESGVDAALGMNGDEKTMSRMTNCYFSITSITQSILQNHASQIFSSVLVFFGILAHK